MSLFVCAYLRFSTALNTIFRSFNWIFFDKSIDLNALIILTDLVKTQITHIQENVTQTTIFPEVVSSYRKATSRRITSGCCVLQLFLLQESEAVFSWSTSWSCFVVFYQCALAFLGCSCRWQVIVDFDPISRSFAKVPRTRNKITIPHGW